MTATLPGTVVLPPFGPRGRRVRYPIEELPGLWFPVAEPADDRIYFVDASAPLCGGEVESAVVSVSPSGEGELVPWHVAVEGSAIAIRMFGGVASRVYTISLILTAAEAPWTQRQWFIGLVIDPTSSAVPPPVPPSPAFGDPVMWPCPTPSYGPAKNLPAYTVAAAGTDQLTAAIVPYLANVLVNGGTGGVLIGVRSDKWNGYQVPVQNRSGGPITLYPFSGDQFENLGANAGTVIQNDQSVVLSIAQSGAIIVR